MNTDKPVRDRIASLSPRARMVLRVLCEAADEAWITRLSRAEISDRVGLYVGEGVEPVHAARLVREVVDAGLVSIVGRDVTKNNINEIEVLYPPGIIRENGMVRTAILYDGLTPKESSILAMIAELEWPEDQREWPSTSMLAYYAGVSPGVIRSTLRTLVARGLLKTEEGKRPYPMKYTRTETQLVRRY